MATKHVNQRLSHASEEDNEINGTEGLNDESELSSSTDEGDGIFGVIKRKRKNPGKNPT